MRSVTSPKILVSSQGFPQRRQGAKNKSADRLIADATGSSGGLELTRDHQPANPFVTGKGTPAPGAYPKGVGRIQFPNYREKLLTIQLIMLLIGDEVLLAKSTGSGHLFFTGTV
jgi:hypothetical protein